MLNIKKIKTKQNGEKLKIAPFPTPSPVIFLPRGDHHEQVWNIPSETFESYMNT